MLTALGQDGPGESFMTLWAGEGVDTTNVIRNPSAPTGIYFVTHDARGHHFSFYRSGSAAAKEAGGSEREKEEERIWVRAWSSSSSAAAAASKEAVQR